MDKDIESILMTPDGSKLIWRFTIPELRNQIRKCGLKTSVNRCLGEDDEASFYEWLTDVMKEALQVLGNTQKEPHRYHNKGSLTAEKIKTEVDIVWVINNYVTLKKSGENLSGVCPFHSDKHPSFIVYPNTQSWYCFGCCKGGDVIDFTILIECTDFKGAMNIIKDYIQ